MRDPFKSHTPGLTSPSTHAEEIVPSDDALLETVTRALYVGGAGDVRVRMMSGAAVTLSGVQAGTYYPVRITQILQTGTTATGLVGLD